MTTGNEKLAEKLSVDRVQTMGTRPNDKVYAAKIVTQLALLTTTVLIALLAWYWTKFAYNAWLHVSFPGELDYAEGEVWQQAKLIPGPRMYADYQQSPPFIGFEYPPVYHLVVRGIASLGVPWLLAGRLVSMLSMIVIAVMVGLFVRETSRSSIQQSEDQHAALIGAVVAGMILIMFRPFQWWPYTMRVDVPSVALEMSGMYLGLLSLRRPRLIYASALVFVFAAYTKQTTLAGLLATMAVLVLHSPARGLRAAAFICTLGVAVFAGLTFATDGGFARHIILYNADNRFSLHESYRLLIEAHFLKNYAPYLAISLAAAIFIAVRQSRRPLREIPPGYLIALLYFLLTTVNFIEMGKHGAGDNYLISPIAAWALLIGFAITRVVHYARSSGEPVYWLALAAVLVLQATLAPPVFGQQRFADPEFRREYVDLINQTRQAKKPVLSDDMVLLLQAGKQVPWEPFIITELSAEGLFDERKVVKLIDNHAFAFAVVTGVPGGLDFDAFYSPAVAAALAKAYPIERHVGHMRVLQPSSDQ